MCVVASFMRFLVSTKGHGTGAVQHKHDFHFTLFNRFITDSYLNGDLPLIGTNTFGLLMQDYVAVPFCRRLSGASCPTSTVLFLG